MLSFFGRLPAASPGRTATRLWLVGTGALLTGLIACHHYAGPHRPSAAVRAAAEFLGQVVSLLLVARADSLQREVFTQTGIAERNTISLNFSQTFEGGRRGKSFELLGRAFSEVMDEFRAERAEKEESYRYLQTVMQHVGIGLLSFRQDGTVGLINTAAKRLLRVSHLKHLRALEATAGRGLADTLLRMRSGEKVLVKVVDDDELLQLAIYATEFKLRGDLYKLVSIQDIQSELEEKEIEAWQKLTRVLTHEIMNSITPIASLASTVNDLLADLDAPPADGAADEAADEMIDEMPSTCRPRTSS